MTVFCTIFLLNMDNSQLRYELGHIHEKNTILWRKYIYHVTIVSQNIYQLYNFLCVYPKIFNNFTIFAKLLSHFSGWEAKYM